MGDEIKGEHGHDESSPPLPKRIHPSHARYNRARPVKSRRSKFTITPKLRNAARERGKRMRAKGASKRRSLAIKRGLKRHPRKGRRTRGYVDERGRECAQCGWYKLWGEFPRDPHCPHGRRSSCRGCRNKMERHNYKASEKRAPKKRNRKPKGRALTP